MYCVWFGRPAPVQAEPSCKNFLAVWHTAQVFLARRSHKIGLTSECCHCALYSFLFLGHYGLYKMMALPVAILALVMILLPEGEA